MSSLTQERVERFKSVVDSLKSEVIVLITQIDPDALGAAFGIAHLMWGMRDKLKIKIVYCGAIGHRQNGTIINKLNLQSQLISVQQFVEPVQQQGVFQAASIVLVDSSDIDESRIPSQFRPIDPAIVIDHHRGGIKDEREDQFVWIDGEVGAASTLVTELFLEFHEIEVGIYSQLLALGIYTDTKSLVSASSRDRDAFAHVVKGVTPEQFKQFVRYPLSRNYYEHLKKALDSKIEEGSHIIASCGTMHAEDGDDLAIIADDLIRMTGITLVVVFGIIGNQVRLSARSNNISLALDQLLKNAFGEKNAGAKLSPDGIGEGGGLISIDLGPWLTDNDRDLREQIVLAKMKRVILDNSDTKRLFVQK